MNDEQPNARLQGYLKSLNLEELDEVLEEVLQEIRTREIDAMKKDVMTHSQRLRLGRKQKP
jgi:hypothetical protein